MIFDGITSKLFNATVKKLQGGIDSIQTTSRATLSNAGWYRVAQYATTDENVAKGFASNSCELTIKQRADNTTGEFIKLRLESVLRKQSITALSVKRHSTSYNAFTKCRYTYDSTGAYLEVYYNLSSRNVCLFAVDNPLDLVNTWKAITPTLTAETVDGVTVTTTYDIPANASPVTDLDIAEAQKSWVISNTLGEVGSEEELNTVYTSIHNNMPNAMWYRGRVKHSATIGSIKGGMYYLEGYRHEAGYGWQKITKYNNINDNSIPVLIFARSLYSGTWGEWDAITADFSNFLDKSKGGYIGGTVIVSRLMSIGEDSDANAKEFNIRNFARRVQFYLDETGNLTFYDNTNKKQVFQTKVDGTNTWNGVASGCVPRDSYGDYNNFYKGLSVTDASGEGGGEIRFAQPQTDHSFENMITQDIWRDAMRIFATHDGKTKLFNIDFSTMKEGVNEALHTGNSTGIVFTEDDNTAPRSDMLWAHL